MGSAVTNSNSELRPIATIPLTRPRAVTRLRLSVNWRLAAQAAALFVVFAALFAVVQFATPGIADNDGYYHIKMGLLVREQGLKPPFVWLPLSILSRDAFYDHHLLYHVYLSLFAGDTSPQALTLGAKIAALITPALAFVAIWWLLRGQGVRWASIW